MGLTINGYSSVIINSLDDSYDEAYINPDFPHAVPPEWAGREYVNWSKTDSTRRETINFSYSGYGQFRGQLSEFSTGVNSYSDETFWDRLADGEFAGARFIDLINFSDCEGCFYGRARDAIAQELVSNHPAFCEFAVGDAYLVERYEDVMRVFENARDSGIVIFS